ncbi:DUF3306 domain-containing protein [Methylobacterium terrae]|uniref:DUF3306 domain-containing protein n=1 Tax=Methylobacterium terrae TaxID=2202827 RepID=A0A2U8WP75_9HYPH|nr:DUF3306 domain-containing protein [Methylobacterium terrae]AWN47260.1 DUF3306 domain-containing protein [Methylobacterium terrae]
MSDGFLARWSRRKRDEARRPPESAPEAAAPIVPGTAPAEDELSLGPEELAQLPSLDALTAATDLTPFLRVGVPRALRNAALRRMWSIDPAIRDFVSEAREYAYDWNTPGGVPGTGGAISAEDVRAMVEKVFGGGEENPAAVSDGSDEAGDGARPPSPRGREEGRVPHVGGAASPQGEGEAVSPDEAPPAEPPRPRPRSGSARAPVAPDEGGESLSPPAGRGGIPHPSVSPNSPPLAEVGGADQAPGFSAAEATPRLASDRPSSPAPPRLQRHGGALPI